ncbi:MAG: cellulase family glycosylhydrolase [Spirochaetaceae bacterium]|jgi:hypothetical protein|nr:cellulase family glycosylhydrolase [Spirochaetaceae bacterium]
MKIENQFFKDDEGRTLILRGCNLGGSSKIPMRPCGATYLADSLENACGVSFVGRPFPLEVAENEFAKLKSFGFNVVRFVITWEALEHAGIGIYDEEYLDYLYKIMLIAKKNNIAVYMDPHQDVWSRWTGGDGAPAWTLEMLGMDISVLDETGAALTHQHYGNPFPRMIWPTNNYRYAAATMFTLFFAGDVFAPKTQINGVGVQTVLNESYIACMKHCYAKLKDTGVIIGWGAMNEPGCGYAGLADLGVKFPYLGSKGPMPTGFEGMAAAGANCVYVDFYEDSGAGSKKKGKRPINPNRIPLFKNGFNCPWKAHGVWDDSNGEPVLLKPDYFSSHNGRAVNFAGDFLKPFMCKFVNAMRELDEKTFLFIEGSPMEEQPMWSADDPVNCVNAFHWYDGITLFLKAFHTWWTIDIEKSRPIIGAHRVAAHFSTVLKKAVIFAKEKMNNMPSFLGEFGLPFDMNKRCGFNTKKEFSKRYALHEKALSYYYDAIDDNLLSATIWTYTYDNTHENGDNWNGEDLSIFCTRDNAERGRAERGWLRPYPMATAGEPLSIKWNYKTKIFCYRFKPYANLDVPTIIFTPDCFGGKFCVTIKNEKNENTGRVVSKGSLLEIYDVSAEREVVVRISE